MPGTASSSAVRVVRGARLPMLVAVVASLAAAQAPIVTKVEPPNWWAGHSINPVRLLIRGANLGGAALACPTPLQCGGARVNDVGSYVFVDVTVPAGTKPRAYPLTVRTRGGQTTFDFTVSAPLPRAGRFAGFDVNDVVYLIMPDRFVNGDPSNDAPAKSPGLIDRAKGRYYHGGDLAGVRQKLPYLKSLGITAIWMTPVYDNNDNVNEVERYDGQGVTDYHGYGAIDFYATDEHLGSLDEYRALVDDAHKLGIKVIEDMVANHTGPYHPWVNDPPTPTWYNGSRAQHLSNTWQGWTIADPYSTAGMRKATLEGWFGGFLPDLNQNDPEVARYIIQNTLWWVGMSGVDGIRQDTWQYVPRAFWKPWMAAIKKEFPALRVVGEVFDGDPAVIAFHLDGTTNWDRITTGVDYMFDFPLHFAIRDAFARRGSVRNLAMMVARDHIYADPNRLSPFLGNHDVERFMNERGATVDGLKLATTFLLTTRGIPLLYYGDEIALPGGRDPDNRRDFPGGWAGDTRDAFTAAGRTADEQVVWAHTQKLLQIRAERAELRRAPVEHLVVEDQLYIYKRGKTVIVINNDTAAVEAHVPVPLIGADLLGACSTPETWGTGMAAKVPRRSSCIFPVVNEVLPGPSLGVTGDRRMHRAFPSQFVAPRNVEVWLPPGYAAHPSARYPVLYMHDGQNVFDPSSSYTGADWAVDEWMTQLIAQRKVRPAIVVGVWNTPKRFEEYMPQKAVAGDSMLVAPGRKMPTAGLLSDAYLKFLVTELKPFIDRTYRTKTGPADTFTMGSSMGGLISCYAVAEYPQVFGGAGCVSTHWPENNGAMVDYLKRAMPDPKTHRIYMDHGTATLDAMYAPYQVRADSVMRSAGYVDGRNFMSRVFEGAEHSERAWRVRLDVPLMFLLKP